MEIVGAIVIVILSFVFHCLIYTDDIIKAWYWKLLATIVILYLSFVIITN